jgi:hypothetical protein
VVVAVAELEVVGQVEVAVDIELVEVFVVVDDDRQVVEYEDVVDMLVGDRLDDET